MYCIIVFVGIAGIFNFVLLSILAIGSFARDTPINVQKTSLNSLDNVLYEGKQWVVLVAGTSGWDQYRHQVMKLSRNHNSSNYQYTTMFNICESIQI